MEVILRGSFIYPLHALSLSSNYWDHDTGKEPGCYRSRHRWETCSSSPTQLVSEGQKRNSAKLECKSHSELGQDFHVCQTDWNIFSDTGNWALQEDWGRSVEVTFADPAEEFSSDMLLFNLYLWKPEWQMLHFRLWLGLPNVHFMWQSQLSLAPFTQQPRGTTPTHPFSPRKSK